MQTWSRPVSQFTKRHASQRVDLHKKTSLSTRTVPNKTDLEPAVGRGQTSNRRGRVAWRPMPAESQEPTENAPAAAWYYRGFGSARRFWDNVDDILCSRLPDTRSSHNRWLRRPRGRNPGAGKLGEGSQPRTLGNRRTNELGHSTLGHPLWGCLRGSYKPRAGATVVHPLQQSSTFARREVAADGVARAVLRNGRRSCQQDGYGRVDKGSQSFSRLGCGTAVMCYHHQVLHRLDLEIRVGREALDLLLENVEPAWSLG